MSASKPTVAAIVLAAGASTRMGRPKQLLPYRGRSLLRHMAIEAIASQCYPIIVVLGAYAEQIKPEVNDLDLQVVENQQWAEGIGTSIRAGIAKLTATSQTIQATIVILCDQPLVSSQQLDRLVEAYYSTHSAIVASEYAETLGVPALFSRELFAELMMLDAVTGAKRVIGQHIQEVYPVSFPAGAIDLDTPTDYEQFEKMLNSHVDGLLEKHSNWSCISQAWD